MRKFEVRLRSAAADSTGALEQAHKELTAVRADLERSQEKRQVEANLREVAEDLHRRAEADAGRSRACVGNDSAGPMNAPSSMRV